MTSFVMKGAVVDSFDLERTWLVDAIHGRHSVLHNLFVRKRNAVNEHKRWCIGTWQRGWLTYTFVKRRNVLVGVVSLCWQ